MNSQCNVYKRFYWIEYLKQTKKLIFLINYEIKKKNAR